MSDKKKFKNESQDARRHDQHYATHPFDKPKQQEKSASKPKPEKK